ncbi:MAG: ABC-2 transporter permease [Clostridia bacterium]|nr:ABC-2 transporter permease [Clostridia bacterium]
MKGLLIKDLAYLRQSKALINMLFIAVCFIFMGNMYVLIYPGIMASSMMQTTFSYDEHNSGMKYLMTLPITRRTYVKSKYVLTLVLALSSLSFGLLMVCIRSIVMGGFDLGEVATGAVTCVFVASFLSSVNIPLIIRHGIEKGRNISSTLLLVIAAAVSFGMASVIGTLDTMSELAALTVILGCTVIMVLTSFRISLKNIGKREY